MHIRRQREYYYFTGLDDAWKMEQELNPDTIEAHFGLFYANRTIKPWIQAATLGC